MIRLMPAILQGTFMILSFWSTCSVASLNVEERLVQLETNYIKMEQVLTRHLEVLKEENIKKQDILKAQATRMKELEVKIELQEQELLGIARKNLEDISTKAEIQRQHAPGSQDPQRQAKLGAVPRSCADLKDRGHTLNGVYLVWGGKSVVTVHCDFCKQKNDPGFETLIGFANVKSMPTYFYVQKSDSFFNSTQTPIPFDTEQLNVGGAMNLQTGKFTAPRPGIYFFSFTGLASFPPSTTFLPINIALYKNSNNNAIGLCHADETVSTLLDNQFETFSLQSTVHLKKGDQVWVEIQGRPYTVPPKGVYLYGNRFIHFNGWLLEEDIFL